MTDIWEACGLHGFSSVGLLISGWLVAGAAIAGLGWLLVRKEKAYSAAARDMMTAMGAITETLAKIETTVTITLMQRGGGSQG